MENTITAIERLNKIQFIKSYPIFRQLPLQLNQIQLIELVLSYQLENKQCYLNRKEIATFLKLNGRTTDNLVLQLKKAGYITTKQTYNTTKTGGSSSSIWVNLEFIFDILDSNELVHYLESL
jgi:DNA-binding transcriptional regulator YhcF (GntR family)